MTIWPSQLSTAPDVPPFKVSLRVALALGVLLLGAPLLVAPVAAASSRAGTPRVRTVWVAGRLYTVGCMTSSLCVAGGLTRGQGLPAQVVVLAAAESSARGS